MYSAIILRLARRFTHTLALAGPYTAWRPRRCVSSLPANFQLPLPLLAFGGAGNGEMRFTQGHN